MKRLIELLADKKAAEKIHPILEKLELRLAGASKEDIDYKYRLIPKGEHLPLAHFNTAEEIEEYLNDMLVIYSQVVENLNTIISWKEMMTCLQQQ